MPTEEELLQKIEQRFTELAQAQKDVDAVQAQTAPVIQNKIKAQQELRQAQGALERYRLDNFPVEEVKVTPRVQDDFFAVEYTGPASIPSINLWFKKHHLSDWSLQEIKTDYKGYEDTVWLYGDEHFSRQRMKPGEWIVLREDAYPDHVEVYGSKNSLLGDYDIESVDSAE